MELYKEEIIMEKKSKVPMIILISIVILVIITGFIIARILQLKKMVINIKIDGVRNKSIVQILDFESAQQTKKLYIPIVRIAEYFGYEGFLGDYTNKSEDKTKCHVKCEYETAMFSLNSNELVKITEDNEYEYIILEEPVIEKDGELYTTIEGIEKAFNVDFSSDAEYKNIEIYTMDYLVQYFAQKYKVEETVTEEFSNKKAIFEDMLVIENDKTFGVLDTKTQKFILESKYEEIKYLPATTDFLVKSNGKYGIVAKDNKIKINTVYDEIKNMNNKTGLYLVKKNNAYGVVNTEGNVIIQLDYKQIGVDIDKYVQNGVENPYILLNEIIPVKNDQNLWALFDINGKKITEFKYTEIGCEKKPETNSYPTLVIPSYKLIVVESDKYYNLVNLEGTEMISGNILDSVYLKYNTKEKQNKYYMTSSNNTKVLDIEEWLISIGE